MSLKSEFPSVKIELKDPIQSGDPLYVQKGVRVDRVKPQIPVFLSDRNGKFTETEAALKYNIPGYYNARYHSHGEEPHFFDDKRFSADDPEQHDNVRHPKKVIDNERQVIRRIKEVPQLFWMIPHYFESGEMQIATEFIEGELLRTALERGDMSQKTRLRVAAQLIDYVVYMHKNGTHHNDMHGKNIILAKDDTIVVIDYSKAGEKQGKKEKYYDVNELNKWLVRLITIHEPTSFHGKHPMRELNEEEIRYLEQLRPFLQAVPLKEEDLYKIHLDFVEQHKCPHGMISVHLWNSLS